MNWDEANKVITVIELLEQARKAAIGNPAAMAIITKAIAELIQISQPDSL